MKSFALIAILASVNAISMQTAECVKSGDACVLKGTTTACTGCSLIQAAECVKSGDGCVEKGTTKA